jgi:site-specific recombinase XerD
MDDALTTSTDRSLAEATEAAAKYAKKARSDNTIRAYAQRLRAFSEWCVENGLSSKPPVAPNIVAAYIAELADVGKSPSTIELALVAISQAHKLSDLPSPRASSIVREVWSGIRKEKGVAPQTKAAPLGPAELRTISRRMTNDLLEARDRAILLIGFAGCFRRSEIASLNVSDIVDRAERGLLITLRKSKGDQMGHGEAIGVPRGSDPLTCPVRALKTWLEAANVTDGPLFVSKSGKRLHPYDVARIIQSRAKEAGIAGNISGHSLRAGLITTAAREGRTLSSIQRQSRQKTLRILMGYVREEDAFKDNAAAGIGL